MSLDVKTLHGNWFNFSIPCDSESERSIGFGRLDAKGYDGSIANDGCPITNNRCSDARHCPSNVRLLVPSWIEPTYFRMG